MVAASQAGRLAIRALVLRRFAVVRRLPTSLASTGTLLVPPLGVMFSAWILGEQVGFYEISALVLVFAAMLLILPGFDWRASLSPEKEPR